MVYLERSGAVASSRVGPMVPGQLPLLCNARPARVVHGHAALDDMRFSANIPQAVFAARNSYRQQQPPAHLVPLGPPVATDAETKEALMASLLNHVMSSLPTEQPRRAAHQRRRGKAGRAPRMAKVTARSSKEATPSNAYQRLPRTRSKGSLPEVGDPASADAAPSLLRLQKYFALAMVRHNEAVSTIAHEEWARHAILHSPRSTLSQRRRLGPTDQQRALAPATAAARRLLPRSTQAELMSLYAELSAGLPPISRQATLLDLQERAAAACHPPPDAAPPAAEPATPPPHAGSHSPSVPEHEHDALGALGFVPFGDGRRAPASARAPLAGPASRQPPHIVRSVVRSPLSGRRAGSVLGERACTDAATILRQIEEASLCRTSGAEPSRATAYALDGAAGVRLSARALTDRPRTERGFAERVFTPTTDSYLEPLYARGPDSDPGPRLGEQRFEFRVTRKFPPSPRCACKLKLGTGER
jgi:hypothetical protein